MSSSARKAWLVAASIGVVEALKDQAGFCRWNYAIRHATNNLRSHRFSSAAVVVSGKRKLKQSEESLRKVMFFSSWAPN